MKILTTAQTHKSSYSVQRPQSQLCVFFAVALWLSLAASTAHSADKYTLGTSVTKTGWTGLFISERAKFVKGSDGPYQGIYKLEWWEKGDSACKMKATSRHLNTYKTEVASWDKCRSGGVAPKGRKVIEFTNLETYITGIQLCLSPVGVFNIGFCAGGCPRTMKGAKIWGRKLNRATGVLESAGTKKFSRTNCKEWSVERHCPAGKVATHIEINSSSAHAVKLHCKSVIKK